MPEARHLERGLLAALLLALIVVVIQASWIEAKARLAQILIADAWAETLQSGTSHKPWPWADTWPVLRLTLPDGEHQYVLESASGEALAFGPGRIEAGSEGSGVMIAGHRDTHFRFLRNARVGDWLKVQGRDGVTQRYQIHNLRVADSRQEVLHAPSDTSSLMLITCYPFESTRTDGALRYLVSATLSGDAGNTL